MADAFTFSQPSPQQTTRGMGSGIAVGPVNVGAEQLSKGMESVGAALAQAMQFRRAQAMQDQAVSSYLQAYGGGAGGTIASSAPNAPNVGADAGATGGSTKTPAGGWGGFAPADVQKMTVAAAQKYGVDPQAALQMLSAESGGGAAYYGDGNKGSQFSSFGPFQLHYGGINPNMSHAGMGNDFTTATGLDARDPKTIPQQIDFAMQHAAQNGWGAWATSRNKLGFNDWTGINRGSQQANMPAPNAQPTAGSGLPPGAPPPDQWGGRAANQGPELVGNAGGPPNQGPELVGARAGGEGFQPPANPPTPPPRPANLGQQPIPPDMQATAPALAPARPMAPPPPQPGPTGGNLLSQGPGGSGLSMYGGGGGSPGQAAVASAMAPRSPMPQFSAPATGLQGMGNAAAPSSGPAAAQQPGGGAPNVIPGLYPGSQGGAAIPPTMQAQQQGGQRGYDPKVLWALQNSGPYAPKWAQDAAAEILKSRANPSYEVKVLGHDADGNEITGLVDPHSQQPVGVYRNGQLVPVGAGAISAAADQPPPGVNVTPEQWSHLSVPERKKMEEESGSRLVTQGMPNPAEMQAFGSSMRQGKPYQELSEALPTWNSLPGAALQDTTYGDTVLIDGVARVLNPGLGVRQSTYDLYANEQNQLNRFKGEVDKVLYQGGTLTPQTRAQMLEAAYGKMVQYRRAWDADVAQGAKLAGKYGWDTSMTIPSMLDSVRPVTQKQIESEMKRIAPYRAAGGAIPQGPTMIGGDDDPAYQNLQPGQKFVGPDGVTYSKR